MTCHVMADRTAALARQAPATYETYRKIRKQPTVAFGRFLAAAPLILGEWSLEADDDVPDERIAFIRKQIMPLRYDFMFNAALFGNIDYGWCPFEKVFATAKIRGREHIVLARLKPLLVDLTDILIDPDMGHVVGFRQSPQAFTPRSKVDKSGYIIVDEDRAFVCNFRVEGDYHYGEPLLENVRHTFADWDEANAGASRYDQKIAGAQWLIGYPSGSEIVAGESKTNREIAREVIANLESSGSIAYPKERARFADENAPQEKAWDIELKEHGAKQASFIDRQNYCDKLFMRGLLIPERAALEGQYGTKADATTHTDLAIGIREAEHIHVTRLFQEGVVNHLLRLNFGEDAIDTIRVEASPLVDAKRKFFETLYASVLNHPVVAAEVVRALDIDALMDTIGAPKVSDVAMEDEGGAANIVAGGGFEDAFLEQLGKLYQQVNGAT
jgi:hypothetical protein